MIRAVTAEVDVACAALRCPPSARWPSLGLTVMGTWNANIALNIAIVVFCAVVIVLTITGTIPGYIAILVAFAAFAHGAWSERGRTRRQRPVK